MSLLDGLFTDTTQLTVADAQITGPATIEPGYMYLVASSATDVIVTIATHPVAQLAGVQIALKVIAGDESEPGILKIVAAPGTRIQDDAGNLGLEALITGGQVIGTYREWLCDDAGTFWQVRGGGGSGGGGGGGGAVVVPNSPLVADADVVLDGQIIVQTDNAYVVSGGGEAEGGYADVLIDSALDLDAIHGHRIGVYTMGGSPTVPSTLGVFDAEQTALLQDPHDLALYTDSVDLPFAGYVEYTFDRNARNGLGLWRVTEWIERPVAVAVAMFVDMGGKGDVLPLASLPANTLLFRDGSNHIMGTAITTDGANLGNVGSITLANQKITGLATPTAPTDAATKAYADSAAAGVAVTAGAGLTRTGASIDVGANADGSIAVGADDIKVGVLATDAQHGTRGGGTLHAAASSTVAGFMSAGDKTKLNGIATGADVTTAALAGATAAISINNQKITNLGTPGASSDAATKGYVDGVAVTGGAGLIRTGNSLDVGANADGSIVVNADDIKVGVLATDVQHGTRGGGTQHATAVAGGAAGFISGADQTKLNGIATGADVTTTALAAASAAVSVNNQRITGLATPSSGTDAANKAYVDAAAQGLDVKHACRLLTAANVGLSGLAAIDGVTPVAGDRVLVTGQTTQSANGIYVAASGAWSRATDADTSAEVTAGMFAFVTEGTVYGDTGWVLTTNDPIVLGTSALVFAQFSSSGTVAAGAGLTRTGNTLDVGANADGSIIVNADDIKVGVLATDAQHGTRGGGTIHAAATTSVAGFMSAADKTKVNALTFGQTAGTYTEGNDARLLWLVNALLPPTNELRLSGSSTDAVCPAGDFTTLYLTPYLGNRIALYYNGAWALFTPGTVSKAVSTGGFNSWEIFDVFAYSPDGSNVSLEFSAKWTNSTTRPVAIQLTDGVWTKTTDKTRRYLGTCRASSSTTIAHNYAQQDTNSVKMGIWNADNQVRRGFYWSMSATWTIPTANSWLAIGGYGNAGMEFIHGLYKFGQCMDMTVMHSIGFSNSGSAMVSIGKDATTPWGRRSYVTALSSGNVFIATADWANQEGSPDPQFGFANYKPLVWANTTSAAVQGNNDLSSNHRSGMIAYAYM